jgi:hypothetical protein
MTEISISAGDPHEGRGDTSESLSWGLQMFRSADTSDGLCPEVIDITGRPRHLFTGPNLELAPGRWRATVSLELCPDAARRTFALDFGTGTDFAAKDIPHGVSGAMNVSIEHELKPGDLAELRLWLHRAAFHGEIRLLGAVLERLDGRPPGGAD